MGTDRDFGMWRIPPKNSAAWAVLGKLAADGPVFAERRRALLGSLVIQQRLEDAGLIDVDGKPGAFRMSLTERGMAAWEDYRVRNTFAPVRKCTGRSHVVTEGERSCRCGALAVHREHAL